MRYSRRALGMVEHATIGNRFVLSLDSQFRQRIVMLAPVETSHESRRNLI
jgi:hypothetical protein